MKNIVAGVDIGGTHVTVCLVDISSGELQPQSHTRISIDPSIGKEEVIQAWANVIQESFEKAALPVGKTGIAMPGPFDYEKGISYIKGLHKYESLYGENVKELLAAKLGISPGEIIMINDASAYLIGEMNSGAAVGYDNIVGVTLGTGLGSAAFFDGRLQEGDLWCMPYKNSRAEDYLSARWLLNTYEESTSRKLPHVKALAELVATDVAAEDTFVLFGKNLGSVLVQRYKAQQPQVFVIGGNIVKAWNYFVPSLQETINQLGENYLLKPALLGEDAALIGAASYWKYKNINPTI